MRVSRGKLIFEGIFSIGFIVFFAFLIVDCARREVVTCDRKTGQPRCVVEVRGLFSSRSTSYDELAGVRVVEHESRGGHWYEIALKDRAGREHLVADSIDPDEAKRVEAWFVDRTARVQAVREPHSDGLLILSLLFIAAIAFLLWVWISNWRDYRAAKER